MFLSSLLVCSLVVGQANAPQSADAAPKPEGAPAADTQQKVAVPDFSAPAGQEPLGVMLSGVVGHEIERLGLFKVVTSEQVRAVLSVERQKALMGCGDECGSGATSAGSLLGVDLLVTGRLSRLGAKKGDAGTLSLEMTLLESATGQRKGSSLLTAASESELINKLPEAVVTLMSKVLEGKQGALVVTTTDLGASVKVDGTIVGTTPLEGRLALAAGPHMLRIEKEGFVAAQKEVRIAPDKVTEENVRLVPSPDFAAAYEQKEGRLRLGTWLCAGVAVIGLGTFVGMQTVANQKYGAVDQPNTFAYHRKFLLDGVETSPDTSPGAAPDAVINHRTLATQYKNEIQSDQTISYVGGGIGLAAAIAGTALAVISDDPNRYKQFKAAPAAPGTTPAPAPAAPAAPKAPKATGLILPGGGAFVLSGEF